MRAVLRFGCAGAVALAAVTASVGVAGAAPKEVSSARFAATVCGAYQDLQQARTEYDDAYVALPTVDPAATQAQVGDLTEGLVDDVSAIRTKIKNQYPAVDDGEKISKLFVKNFKAIENEVSSALEALQASDPAGATFTADLTTFEAALSALGVETSDPFRKVNDQDVIAAFDDEKSCDEVVEIVG